MPYYTVLRLLFNARYIDALYEFELSIYSTNSGDFIFSYGKAVYNSRASKYVTVHSLYSHAAI